MNKLISLLILSASLTALTACGSKSNSDVADAVRTQSLKDSPTPYSVSDADRTAAVDELIEFRKKMLALEGKLIAPAKEDQAQYTDLLQDSRAGLARVFPRDSGNERRPLLVNGQGAYFQFKGRTNEYGRGSDIEYSTTSSPQFSVGFAGVDFGFIAQLGKIDIRQLDEHNSVVAFAASFVSPNGQRESVWRDEQRKWSAGVSNDGVLFKNRTEAVVGMSYVVRSLNENGYDVLAVVQVVRRDPTDESLTLAWKLLREFDKPVLNRN